MPRRNDKVAKEIRRTNASERQELRDSRLPEDQIAVLRARGIEDGKEMKRLTREVPPSIPI